MSPNTKIRRLSNVHPPARTWCRCCLTASSTPPWSATSCLIQSSRCSFRTLRPPPRLWATKHGNPINHMLVVRSELSSTRPDVVREVFRIFKESRDIAVRGGNKNAAQLNYGVEGQPARPSKRSSILRYDQKLIPRRYSVEELFDETTRSLA